MVILHYLLVLLILVFPLPKFVRGSCSSLLYLCLSVCSVSPFNGRWKLNEDEVETSSHAFDSAGVICPHSSCHVCISGLNISSTEKNFWKQQSYFRHQTSHGAVFHLHFDLHVMLLSFRYSLRTMLWSRMKKCSDDFE